MDRATAIFVDGFGAAAATSGILNQLQGRIFALLYLTDRPMSLDEIAAELQQSKSNISITIRGVVEWHLVRRVSVPGSRKDHYEAATDFWRATQEIMERRIRWTLRQVVATVDETKRVAEETRHRGAKERRQDAFRDARLATLRQVFAAWDEGVSAFTQGQTLKPDALRQVPPPRRVSNGD
jgi:DNA-binding transcriptional regulator GbsR (MarR family)